MAQGIPLIKDRPHCDFFLSFFGPLSVIVVLFAFTFPHAGEEVLGKSLMERFNLLYHVLD